MISYLLSSPALSADCVLTVQLSKSGGACLRPSAQARVSVIRSAWTPTWKRPVVLGSSRRFDDVQYCTRVHHGATLHFLLSSPATLVAFYT